MYCSTALGLEIPHQDVGQVGSFRRLSGRICSVPLTSFCLFASSFWSSLSCRSITLISAFIFFLFLLKYSWFNSLLPSSHSILPVRVFVCVQISFSIKTPYCHLGGPLCSSLSSSSLIKSTMSLFPKRVTF